MTATVEGEVQREGTYPIRPGVTTVRKLVEMAGGFTSDAELPQAVLRRRWVEVPRDSLEFFERIPPELLSREERRILQVTSRASDENVVLDLRNLLAEDGSSYDLPLQNGDRLYVPEKRNELFVLGAVQQPGIVAYVPGQPIDYFVEMAGGYSHRADRADIVVLDAKSGNPVDHRDVTALAPGDRIIVPFSEQKTLLERMQTVQGVVNTVSGLVLTIVGLERLWDVITN